MRTIALSIAAACLITAAPAFAQDRPVNMLAFDQESSDAQFMPPPLRYIFPCCDASASSVIVKEAESRCAADVEYIRSYRRRIYLACVRKRTDPAGITVVEMDDPQQVAAMFGTTAD